MRNLIRGPETIKYDLPRLSEAKTFRSFVANLEYFEIAYLKEWEILFLPLGSRDKKAFQNKSIFFSLESKQVISNVGTYHILPYIDIR